MLSFINNITETKSQRCSREQWLDMVKSSQNAQYIKMYRRALKTDERRAVSFKQRLQAVNFQGYDLKVLNGGYGSRKAADMLPTGLFMLDIDHIEKPLKVFAELQLLIESKAIAFEDVALVHITPSGKGLRIVMKGRRGSSIEEDQKWLADLLGVEYDRVTKDLSRWSFVPLEKEVLMTNDELLFGMPLEDIYEVGEKTFVPAAETKDETKGEAVADDGETDAASGKFPADYHGIPYGEIVTRYIGNGGTPVVGDRHATLVKLALDLRHITDNNVDWMMELIPTFGKTRSEKREVIRWAAAQPLKSYTRRMANVLSDMKAKYGVDDIEVETQAAEAEAAEQQGLAEMPQLPERLPSLIELLTSKVMPFQKAAVASMVFPPLQAHIQNCKFLADDHSTFEMSGMCVLVGKQSVGKSCVDMPIECIMENIAENDADSRERERAWAAQQQNKKANEKGAERPPVVIRYLNNDITPAALIQRLFNAENCGERKNLFTFTKVDEIEELYAMAPNQGKANVSQLIKKCWDCGRIGAERYTANAANFEAHLRWNWTGCGTIEKVVHFFQKALVDGTLSRVDFATIIQPEGRIRYRYGLYDDAFRDALKPYIDNLEAFQCETDSKGKIIPFAIERLQALSDEMTDYIERTSAGMETTTWRDFAWRTKMVAVKKILTLYIANGCRWEDAFDDFFWYSFNYSMWCKMNLFYEKATEDFTKETIVAPTQVKSVFCYLPEQFTKEDFKRIVKSHDFKTEWSTYFGKILRRGKIVECGNGVYRMAE